MFFQIKSIITTFQVKSRQKVGNYRKNRIFPTLFNENIIKKYNNWFEQLGSLKSELSSMIIFYFIQKLKLSIQFIYYLSSLSVII